MASPISIDVDRQISVVLNSNFSDCIVNAEVNVPSAQSPYGVDASNGAGGTISVFGTVIAQYGIFDPTATRTTAYNVVVHSEGQIIAERTGIYVNRGGSGIINHGSISSGWIGISAASIGPTSVLNTGVITAGRGMDIQGSGNTISNFGTILASENGIVVNGTAGGAITNSGLIDAVGSAIFVSNVAGNVITNTGTIRGQALGIRGGDNSERVLNRGSIEGGINLNSGDDYLDNRLGVIVGTAILGAGHDTAFGGVGNDKISDWVGDDFVDAGDGIDTLTYEDYAGADIPATVDLAISGAQDTGWGNDILLNFENVTGSGGADSLAGNDGNNLLSGLGGADILVGGNGHDTLAGGNGNDQIDGGEGIDTTAFSGNAIAIVDLRVSTVQDTGYGVDILTSIENVSGSSVGDLLTGSAVANVLIGNGGADLLSGLEGNDTLDGGADNDDLRGGDGHDQLLGGDGADLLFGEAGDDLFKGGQGNDTLDGGSGANTAVFSGASADYTIVVTADGFATVSDKRTNGDGVDVVKNIAYLQFTNQTLAVKAPVVVTPAPVLPLTLIGTKNADRLTGAATDDTIAGLAGNDVLRGEAGNDRLSGGVGKDVLTGGSGADIFVFDSKPNKKANLDRVTDFSVVDDTLHLSKKFFNKITKKGMLAKSAFWAGEKAHDANDRLIYNKKTGALFYDSDGTGKIAAVQIATLPKKLKMSALDFFIM